MRPSVRFFLSLGIAVTSVLNPVRAAVYDAVNETGLPAAALEGSDEDGSENRPRAVWSGDVRGGIARASFQAQI